LLSAISVKVKAQNSGHHLRVSKVLNPILFSSHRGNKIK